MKIKNNIDSPKNCDIEELINYIANTLTISEDSELTLMYNDKLLDQLSKGEVEYEALLQNPIPDKYVL